MWYDIKENIPNTLDNYERLLPFIESFPQLIVDSNNVVYIPEDLLQEV